LTDETLRPPQTGSKSGKWDADARGFPQIKIDRVFGLCTSVSGDVGLVALTRDCLKTQVTQQLDEVDSSDRVTACHAYPVGGFWLYQMALHRQHPNRL
jgi:hypothetical protein